MLRAAADREAVDVEAGVAARQQRGQFGRCVGHVEAEGAARERQRRVEPFGRQVAIREREIEQTLGLHLCPASEHVLQRGRIEAGHARRYALVVHALVQKRAQQQVESTLLVPKAERFDRAVRLELRQGADRVLNILEALPRIRIGQSGGVESGGIIEQQDGIG